MIGKNNYFSSLSFFEFYAKFPHFISQGSPDLKAAREVADYLGTVHHEFHFTVQVIQINNTFNYLYRFAYRRTFLINVSFFPL